MYDEITFFLITSSFQSHEQKSVSCMGTFHDSNFPIIVSFPNQSWGSGEEELGSMTLRILHFRFPSQPASLKPWFDDTLESWMHMMKCLDTDDYSMR